MSNDVLMEPLLPFKFLGLGFLLGFSTLLAAFPARSTPAVTVYTDKATGCQYLYRPYHGGITPRLDGHGHHLCTAPAVN